MTGQAASLRAAWKLILSRQFGLFVLAGGFAAIMNWGSRIALNQVMDFRLAVLVAYGIGMSMAFMLNKWFVFPPSGGALRVEISYFVFFNIAAFPLVWVASVFLAEYAMPKMDFTWYPREFAHAIAIALPLLINFFLHKFITFRPRGLLDNRR